MRVAGSFVDDGRLPHSGIVEITFSIYSQPVGGRARWSETQDVDVQDNHYEILLGATQENGISAQAFDDADIHWLGVQVAGQKEFPRTTRIETRNVPGSSTRLLSSGVSLSTAPSRTSQIAIDDVGTNLFRTAEILRSRSLRVSSTTLSPAADVLDPVVPAIWVRNDKGPYVANCEKFAGADAGEQINACIASLPLAGGTADARNITGDQFARETIAINKPVKLLLGNANLTLAGSPGIACDSTGGSVYGMGENQGTMTALVTNSGTADMIQANRPFCLVSNLLLRSSVPRMAGAAIAIRAGNGYFQNLRIERTYNGIAMQCAGCGGNVSHIQMGAGSSGSGNWNAGIIMGGFDSGTVASTSFNDVAISGDAPFEDAMIVIDSGVDSPKFVNIDAAQGGSDSVVLKLRKTGDSVAPRWVRFTNAMFEAGHTKNGIEVTDCTDARFINSYIAGSLRGIYLNGSPGTINGFTWANGIILVTQQEGVLVDGAARFEILNNRIGNVSQAASGQFPSVRINNGASNFSIVGNDFTSNFITSKSTASYNVLVEKGASDHYVVANNQFLDFEIAGISDLGAGKRKILGPNLSH